MGLYIKISTLSTPTVKIWFFKISDDGHFGNKDSQYLIDACGCDKIGFLGFGNMIKIKIVAFDLRTIGLFKCDPLKFQMTTIFQKKMNMLFILVQCLAKLESLVLKTLFNIDTKIIILSTYKVKIWSFEIF